LLLICGFILRFEFVHSTKTYVRAPGSLFPFGAEISSIAEHIVRGQGFSSPFLPGQRSDRLDRSRLSSVSRTALPALRHLFRGLGDRAAWHSVHHRRRNRHHHSRLRAPHAGCASRILRGLDLGAQSHFVSLAGFLDLEFIASAFLLSAAFLVTLDVAEKNTRKLWLSLRALWAVTALTNLALLNVRPFTFPYAAFVNHRSFRPWFASAALAGVLLAAPVSPWLIRNELVFVRSVFSPATTGLNCTSATTTSAME
jgi:hypothetical protein